MNLAAKYRPQSFDQVIGNPTIIKSLTAALKRPVVPQSWLLVGPAGLGKTSISRLLAAHFGGQLIEVNAATHTGVDEMRNVIISAQNKAIGSSPNKTIILDECHRLSANAWDSLLKAIEEPPAHVRWILCTTVTGKIPETIKTRCVTYNLKPVDEEAIYGLLQKVARAESLPTSDGVLECCTEAAKGSPRQALTNLDICANAATPREAAELLRQASQAKGPIELAKLLMSKQKPSWGTVVKYVSAIDSDPESIRIVLSNYVAGALLKTTSEADAQRLMHLLQCFSEPYNQSDGKSGLLLSIGVFLYN